MSKKIKGKLLLRFAPSPSKDLDISNLRIAIFNHLVSKQKNEDLIIRIEDIDNDKIIEGKDKEILELLNLFSIDHSRVIHQSESLKYHQKMTMALMAQKKAFSCFCSDDKLQELKEEAQKEEKIYNYDGFCASLSDETVLNTNAPFTVRIKKPEKNIKVNDLLKGIFEAKPEDIDSLFILNHNKTPTYNYACAVDDMILNISTVIRDEKYLKESAKQIHIRKELGYNQEISYIHIPSISDEISVRSLINDGFLPSALANYLVLLGNTTPKEIFTLEEAQEWFDISKTSQENLNFDINKLKEINKKYLEEMDEMRLSKILGFADNDIGKLAKLFLEEVSTINELKEKLNLIFQEKSNINEELKTILKKAPYMEEFEDLLKYLEKESSLEKEELNKALKYILLGNSKIELAKAYPLLKNYLGEIVK